MGNGTRPKTTKTAKNHKDGKKPQARQKTTKPAKNHKLAQKPQARQKPHHAPFAVLWSIRGRNSSHLARRALSARDTHQTVIDALARGFLHLFPFLTRNALRAMRYAQPENHKLAQKPQARPKTTSSPKNHKPDKKPQARPKTTSSPKNHKLAQKPQARQKTTSSPKNHIMWLLRFLGRLWAQF